MGQVNFPLSGAVVQSFNFSWWPGCGASLPYSLNGTPAADPPTVSLGTSALPEAEKDMLVEIGSYGRQLGRIGDVLAILLRHFKPDGDLTSEEVRAIDDLKRTLHGIADIKERHGSKRVLRP